eukprot:1157183-Pelagomonas_calceolata.AAC.3
MMVQQNIRGAEGNRTQGSCALAVLQQVDASATFEHEGACPTTHTHIPAVSFRGGPANSSSPGTRAQTAPAGCASPPRSIALAPRACKSPPGRQNSPQSATAWDRGGGGRHGEGTVKLVRYDKCLPEVFQKGGVEHRVQMPRKGTGNGLVKQHREHRVLQ